MSVSVLEFMKLANQEFDPGYGGESPEVQQVRRRKLLGLGALGLGAGAAGLVAGKALGRRSVVKHLSDDKNLAEFALQGGRKKFVAHKGWSFRSPFERVVTHKSS